MVVTNNSYGDIVECDYHGTYDLTARLMDQMAIDLPNLENVFAAGNSGNTSCAPFPPGFHTVLGGYQSAKNVIDVGATNDSGLVANFSSRGPVRDGRLKPDIMAMGQLVGSPVPTNSYGLNNGTSMAAPGVAGGVALMYQRYRQLNGGANPKNSLVKALLCNGASDKGPAGPDFTYGFGWMNLVRSIDMLENNRYFSGSVAPSATTSYTITVPAGMAQLKVLLYWNDPAASVLSARTLVNDLDLEVLDPSSATILPKIADTTIANLNLPASTGVDRINNMEQVVINTPVPGTYTLKVKGYAIAQNPTQEYVLVYDNVPVQLKLTAPAGGEAWVPSSAPTDLTKISWDAFGFSSGTATLEFSPDNGASWTTIATNLDINRGIYSWPVPLVATTKALLRLTKNGSGESTTTAPFTIMGLPIITMGGTQCEGYISINWSGIAGVTDYEVMSLQADEMKQVAITNGTSYTFSGLSKDSVYWVTVRPRINGVPGRRAFAVTRQPNSGTCAGTISNNDLKLDAIDCSDYRPQIHCQSAFVRSNCTCPGKEPG
jgi:hypothetical protein